MQKNQQISYFQEILRKSIHLCSLTIPIVYSFVTKETGLLILIPLTLFALLADVARHFLPSVRSLIHTYFGRMMRPHELDSSRFLLNGATYVLMSASLCVLVFPKIIAIISFSILIVSDIAAALIGRRYGRRPFLDKSLVGTMAFVLSGIAVVLFIAMLTAAPWQLVVVGGIGAVVGGIIEAASIRLRMDDNFSIPMSIGITMWGLLFLVGEPVYQQILHILM